LTKFAVNCRDFVSFLEWERGRRCGGISRTTSALETGKF